MQLAVMLLVLLRVIEGFLMAKSNSNFREKATWKRLGCFLLKANFAGARIISFAGPMKQILATVLNMSLKNWMLEKT